MNRTELLQRAIHSAKCRIYRINYDLSCDISLTHQRKAENQKELMNITVEALEKQIPKKPEHDNGAWSTCPACFGSVPNDTEEAVNRETSYCEHCGQALDWSDAE